MSAGQSVGGPSWAVPGGVAWTAGQPALAGLDRELSKHLVVRLTNAVTSMDI